MSDRDSDIEFDFFEDEPATTEAQSTRPSRAVRARRCVRRRVSRRFCA